MAKLKIAHKTNSTLIDQHISPTQVNGTYLGGTGGANQTLTSTGVKTIAVAYNNSANVQVNTDGYIVAQKGIRKFLAANVATASVKTSAYTTVVKLVNAVDANGRSANQGTIACYSPANVAFNASRITNKFVYDFATPPNRYRYVLSDTVAGNGFANVASA